MLFADTKSNRPLLLPMTDLVYDLLHKRKNNARSDIWVFDGGSKEGHIVDAKKSLQHMCHIIANSKETDEYKFTLHDLRRTFATMAEQLNISLYSLKLLMNHSTDNDVTSGYIQLEQNDLRKISQRITDEFKRLLQI